LLSVESYKGRRVSCGITRIEKRLGNKRRRVNPVSERYGATRQIHGQARKLVPGKGQEKMQQRNRELRIDSNDAMGPQSKRAGGPITARAVKKNSPGKQVSEVGPQVRSRETESGSMAS